jgi:hypothetical protein
MSGKFNYALVTKATIGLFGVIEFGIWTAKNFSAIMAEVQDTQTDEAIVLLKDIVTVQFPKVWETIRATSEQPTP